MLHLLVCRSIHQGPQIGCNINRVSAIYRRFDIAKTNIKCFNRIYFAITLWSTCALSKMNTSCIVSRKTWSSFVIISINILDSSWFSACHRLFSNAMQQFCTLFYRRTESFIKMLPSVNVKHTLAAIIAQNKPIPALGEI